MICLVAVASAVPPAYFGLLALTFHLSCFCSLQGDSEFKKRGGADQRAKCSKAKRCYRRKKQCKYNGNRCRHVAQCKRRCNDKC